MKKQNGITIQEKSVQKFAYDILTPIKDGQCASCMFTAGGGKRTIFRYILNNEELLKKVFTSSFNKTILVFVDPDEILDVTPEAYIQLMLDKLLIKIKEQKITINLESFIKNPLLLIKNCLDKLIEKNLKVVFIFNDFEFTLELASSIYLNLESIMAINKTKIVYMFLSTINLFNNKILNKFHNLKHAISRNIFYFPLLSEENSNQLIDNLAKKTNIKLTNQCKKMFYELCGGHPQLLKYSFNNLLEQEKDYLKDCKKSRSFLINNYELDIVCADIWNYLSQEEKNKLIDVVLTHNYNLSSKNTEDYLLNLGIIKKVNNKYQVFGLIFESFIKNKLPKNKLAYNENTKKLYYGEKNYEDKFTYQEFKLLVFFLSNENELINRDQVAEALWGRNYLEKYSDWSIDKTISILRKKLDAIGFPSENLVTLKKRGFSFSNNS